MEDITVSIVVESILGQVWGSNRVGIKSSYLQSEVILSVTMDQWRWVQGFRVHGMHDRASSSFGVVNSEALSERRGDSLGTWGMHELINKSAVQLDNPDKFLSRLSPLPLRKGQQSAGSQLCMLREGVTWSE